MVASDRQFIPFSQMAIGGISSAINATATGREQDMSRQRLEAR
jgi:hypothetical protein